MLERLFSSQARIAVLRLFLLNPDERFYVREVAMRSGQPRRGVQRELANLEALRLLEHTIDGNRKYYRVNKDCPIFPELKSLFLKTVGLGEALGEFLRRAQGAIPVAFIYGSYARGEESASSDIDLFVVGNMNARELADILAAAGSELSREINPVMMTPEEFSAKVASGNHFVLSVLEGPKTFLVGNAKDLGSLARGQKAQKA